MITIEVAPDRYAFHRGEEGAYSVAPLKALESLYKYVDYDDWYTSRNDIVEMPSWWSPDYRTVWKSKNGFLYFHVERARAYACTERITADLDTGQEIHVIEMAFK